MQITFNPLVKSNQQFNNSKNTQLKQRQNVSSQSTNVSFQALPSLESLVRAQKYFFTSQKEIIEIIDKPYFPTKDIIHLVKKSFGLPGQSELSQVIDKACIKLNGRGDILLDLADFALRKNHPVEAAKMLGFTATNDAARIRGLQRLKTIVPNCNPQDKELQKAILESLEKFFGYDLTDDFAFDLLSQINESGAFPLKAYLKVFQSAVDTTPDLSNIYTYVEAIEPIAEFTQNIEPLLLNKRTQEKAVKLFSERAGSANDSEIKHLINFMERMASDKEAADLSFRLIKSSFASSMMAVEGLNIFRKAAQNPDLKDILFKHLELHPSGKEKLSSALTYPRKGISNILLYLFPEEKYTVPLFGKIKPMSESGNNEDKFLFYENIGRFLSCSETSDEAYKILKEGFADKHVDIRLSSIDAVVKMLDDEKLFKQADELLWDAIRIDYNMLAGNNGVYTLSMPMGIQQTVIKMYDNVTSALSKKPEGIESIKSHAKEYLDLRSELINAILDKKDMVAKSLADIGI